MPPVKVDSLPGKLLSRSLNLVALTIIQRHVMDSQPHYADWSQA